MIQARRLLRLLDGSGSPDQADLVRSTLALENQPGWSTARLGTEWEDHRLALGHRLGQRYDLAESLHARDQTTAWGPFLLGQLALVTGQRERAVEYFQRAQSLEPEWGFLYDACACAFERQDSRREAYRQRVRAYELRKPSSGSVLWLQWLSRQSRGAAPLLEWVRWCARAGRASFQLGMAENQLWYGVERAQSQALVCWLELEDSNRNVARTSALSSYLFWRLHDRLSADGMLAQADQRLCKRLLFGSFRLQDCTVVADAPVPSLL